MRSHDERPATTLTASWLERSARRDALDGPDVPSTPGAPSAPDAGSGPGVAAVLAALSEPRPSADRVVDALVRFTWERAASKDDLACTLDEVDSLWSLLAAQGRPVISRELAHHCVIDAWVDAVAADRGAPSLDPLSGLHTTGYLVGRIHELDRLHRDEPTPLVLLVVHWPEPRGPWRRIGLMLAVAAALRDHVRAEATLAQVGSHVAIALVPDDARSRLERGVLMNALRAGDTADAQVRVDVVPVSEDRTRLTALITRLHDGSLTESTIAPPSA